MKDRQGEKSVKPVAIFAGIWLSLWTRFKQSWRKSNLRTLGLTQTMNLAMLMTSCLSASHDLLHNSFRVIILLSFLQCKYVCVLVIFLYSCNLQ